MIIVYPNNQKGTITAINTSTSQITVTPLTGGTLPAVVNGDIFSNMAPVDKDGGEGFAQYFRTSTINRYNYVETLSKAVRFTKKELFKYTRAGTINNYIADTKNDMFKQLRIDLSNIFWNGERGEATLADGSKEKLTQGVYPAMVAAGSPNSVTTVATIGDAFEDICLATEYGDYGSTRFAFLEPSLHLKLSKFYKNSDTTRYKPNDEIAKLQLTQVDIGSSKIVLVPYARFRSRADFPSSWADRIFILDMKNINLRQMWGETSGETLDRSGGVARNYKDTWVETTIGVEFFNPLACGWVDVTP